MNKEELLKQYAEEYKNFLFNGGVKEKYTEIGEQLFSEGLYEELNKAKEKVMNSYYKEIVYPLVDELVELLSFEGMVKSVQYRKRAQELKKELEKKDRLFIIRKRALRDFFNFTKIGSYYDEDRKLALALRLGALDFEN